MSSIAFAFFAITPFIVSITQLLSIVPFVWTPTNCLSCHPRCWAAFRLRQHFDQCVQKVFLSGFPTNETSLWEGEAPAEPKWVLG